jgi:hypothetical protein
VEKDDGGDSFYESFIYCVFQLLFFAIFLFSTIIIDLVPNKWYPSTFLGRNCG